MVGKKKKYLKPDLQVIELKGTDIICTSGTQSLSEEDYGDGGFNELM